MSKGRGILPYWRWWPAVALATLVAVSAIGFVHYGQHGQNRSTYAAADNNGPPKEPAHISFWQRTVGDPINLFTGVLAVFTVVLAIATIGLGIVTGLTLRHARDDARRQAQETEDQLRPYVYLKRPRYERHPGAEPATRVIASVHNGGSTPATYFEVSYTSAAIAKGERPKFFGFTTTHIWPILGPNKSLTVELRDSTFTTSANDAAFSEGERFFYVFGEVRYGDVWKKTARTQFAFYVRDSGYSGDRARKMSRPTGNLASFERVSEEAGNT